MGTVPISVICGFKYPLSPGEARSTSSYAQTSSERKITERIWPSARQATSVYASPPEIVSLVKVCFEQKIIVSFSFPLESL